MGLRVMLSIDEWAKEPHGTGNAATAAKQLHGVLVRTAVKLQSVDWGMLDKSCGKGVAYHHGWLALLGNLHIVKTV